MRRRHRRHRCRCRCRTPRSDATLVSYLRTGHKTTGENRSPLTARSSPLGLARSRARARARGGGGGGRRTRTQSRNDHVTRSLTRPDNDDDDDDDTKPQPDHYHPSLPHHVSLSLSRPASLTALTSDAAWRRCRRRRCRSRTPRSDRNLCVQCTIKRSPSKIRIFRLFLRFWV